jgi:DNA-binding CsgD family transcriptional regulator
MRPQRTRPKPDEILRRPAPRLTAETFALGDVEFVVFELHHDPTLPAAFSPAERQIARLLHQGASSAEIARQRRVSYRTVANQLASMYRKLGVNTREELLVALQRNSGGPRRDGASAQRRGIL